MDKEKIWGFVKSIFPYVVILVVILLLKCFVFSTIQVNGDSMMNTLHSKDIMILDKISYRFSEIERFDIIVIKSEREDLIKRVIGLPGEHVAYRDNKLYINGKKVEDQFSNVKTADFELEDIGFDRIPKDMYFVLGDNRTDSIDSRIIGLVPKDKIAGHATFTIFPFSRWGTKK